MILIRLAVIVAVLMALAVPGTRGTLMVLDARRRGRLAAAPDAAGAGPPPPRTQDDMRGRQAFGR
jgi:hypothetical protein